MLLNLNEVLIVRFDTFNVLIFVINQQKGIRDERKNGGKHYI